METRALQIGKTEAERRLATQAVDEETSGSADRDSANDVHGLIAGLVGERKRVLDVGCGSGILARLLAHRQCDIVGIDRDPLAVEEARRVCTHAYVADLDYTALSEIAAERPFDAIVFADIVGQLREPLRVLDECRALLADDGMLVASFSNVAHGALRLALFEGTYDYHDAGTFGQVRSRFYSAKNVEELFVSAGYKIERMERTIAALEPGDFSAEIVAEVQNDPESETLEFVVRATPLSNEAKYRAITKRFLVVNSELGATKQTLARRERELTQLRAELEAAAYAPAATAVRPISMERERRLIDGLRRSLDEAVTQYDRVVAHERELQRQLDKTIGTRDDIAAKHENILGVLKIAAADRDAAKAQLAAVRSDLNAAIAEKAAASELKAQIQLRDARVAQLQTQLQSLQGQLKEAVHGREAAVLRLAEASKDSAKLENALVASWASLEGAERERSEMLEKVLLRSAEAKDELERRDALERELAATRSEIANERVRHGALQAKLTADMEGSRLLCERLEGDVAAATAEAGNQRQWREKIEAKFLETRAEVERLATAYSAEERAAAEVQARLRFTEARLAEQIDALAASAEAESQRIASLIDVVQAGFLWRVKRFLGRFKGRVRT